MKHRHIHTDPMTSSMRPPCTTDPYKFSFKAGNPSIPIWKRLQHMQFIQTLQPPPVEAAPTVRTHMSTQWYTFALPSNLDQMKHQSRKTWSPLYGYTALHHELSVPLVPPVHSTTHLPRRMPGRCRPRQRRWRRRKRLRREWTRRAAEQCEHRGERGVRLELRAEGEPTSGGERWDDGQQSSVLISVNNCRKHR